MLPLPLLLLLLDPGPAPRCSLRALCQPRPLLACVGEAGSQAACCQPAHKTEQHMHAVSLGTSPLLMGILHYPIRLRLKNTSSKLKIIKNFKPVTTEHQTRDGAPSENGHRPMKPTQPPDLLRITLNIRYGQSFSF